MRRVLFVDDEPNVLRGLRRSMRCMRDRWSLHFATSGQEALALLEEQPIDIVVSDMKMPEMDGAALLEEVKQRDPTIMRIILSGHSDRDMILRSVGCSHQYMSKPCEPAELQRAIERAVHLRQSLGADEIQALVGGMDRLPSAPQLYGRLLESLRQPNASLRTVSSIIAEDMSMSAKVLQIVNSSYFGLRRPIVSVERAVTHLGLETVSALVLSTDAFACFEGAQVPEFSIASVWEHSLQTAACAKAIARQAELDDQQIDAAFIGGMLHDLGKVILAGEVPGRFRQALVQARETGQPAHCVEREILGATHAEVGAYLIATWGLPRAIVEAIAYHNEPQRSSRAVLSEFCIVHVANALVHELTAPMSAVDSRLDLDYLEAAGVLPELEVWRQTAGEVLATAESHEQ